MHLTRETAGRYGSLGDQAVCGRGSSGICASEDCSNHPCQRHTKRCPICLREFCGTADWTWDTCFSRHEEEGRCSNDLLRTALGKLTRAFETGEHRELERFVRYDSDGLRNPLPPEVCTNLALGAAYSLNPALEYSSELLQEQAEKRVARRTEQQRLRRARRRHGVLPSENWPPRLARLESHKSSTIHLATGALVLRDWTGNWHYRQQGEIIRVMGLHKGEDFVRDRLDYLRDNNPEMFARIENWARLVTRRHARSAF
jgi:hypothetical protein